MVLQNSLRIDLHTHSILSYDGGISEEGYKKLLGKKVDVVAITDHNRIDFAQKLHQKFGDKIIVGEEILTRDGEVIGLFLTKKVVPGLSLSQTAALIHKQGGLVYIPHPCEKARHSVSFANLTSHIGEIDIIEAFNARSRGRKKEKVSVFSLEENAVVFAASSDAHCVLGVGSAYTILSKRPTVKNLKKLLKDGKRMTSYAPVISYLCPFINKVKKKIFA